MKFIRTLGNLGRDQSEAIAEEKIKNIYKGAAPKLEVSVLTREQLAKHPLSKIVGGGMWKEMFSELNTITSAKFQCVVRPGLVLRSVVATPTPKISADPQDFSKPVRGKDKLVVKEFNVSTDGKVLSIKDYEFEVQNKVSWENILEHAKKKEEEIIHRRQTKKVESQLKLKEDYRLLNTRLTLGLLNGNTRWEEARQIATTEGKRR